MIEAVFNTLQLLEKKESWSLLFFLQRIDWFVYCLVSFENISPRIETSPLQVRGGGAMFGAYIDIEWKGGGIFICAIPCYDKTPVLGLC